MSYSLLIKDRVFSSTDNHRIQGVNILRQGRRNGFVIGGAKKILPRKIFLNYTFISNGYDFVHYLICYLQYPLNIKPILSLLLYTDLYVIKTLKFFWLAKYWGGGAIAPPLPPLFLRPCTIIKMTIPSG